MSDRPVYDSSAGRGFLREYRVGARRAASGVLNLSGVDGRRRPSMAGGVPAPGAGGGAAVDPPAESDPVVLLLTSVAAAVLAATDEVAAVLHLVLAAVEVRVHGVLHDRAVYPLSLDYDLTLESDEPEGLLAQLHEEVRQGSAVLRVVSAGTPLNGRMHLRRG